jgi:ATP synthase protein I
MSDEPDPERLRALEARLARAVTAARPEKGAAGRAFSQGEVAWRMVIELATGIVIGLGIGYGLDRWFGTLPVFLAIFSLLGFAAGIRTMLGTAKELAKRPETGGKAEG